jgi:signal transduction histidine kinase
MDQLQTTLKNIRQNLWLAIALENIIFGLSLYLEIRYLPFKLYVDFVISAALAAILISLVARLVSNYSIQPLKAIWEAVLHLSPADNEPTKAPDIASLTLGQDLVTNLTGQLYQIANIAEHDLIDAKRDKDALSHNFIANALPLPMFVLDNTEIIKFVNKAAAEYIGIDANDLIGKNIYMVLDMSFPSDETFDTWLKQIKPKSATSSSSWERVRLNIRDNHPTLLFDLAAYYNQGNSDGNSTILVMFDHTKQYSQDDQAVSFIALSVHELRTPLTLLRGYVEVFEEELKGKVTPELEDFMNKMKATSEQLTAFVNNILNVARIDNDQLELRLQPEDWSKVLEQAIEAISLRAKVRGIQLEYAINPNLPKVGVDRLSIQEVINNLIDNAIKYSDQSKSIKINSRLNGEGLVETTIQDFGVGIPTAILPNLFTKFYRDHRNRAQIGGTGLGLYLSKAIVTAHEGNLWVNSKEGKGSTFGFTLVPYDQLSKEAKKSTDQELVRNAHGWIKNHSYYRR